MNGELTGIWDEFLGLACEQEWPSVVAGIEALKSSGESQPVAVVTAAGADPTAFIAWVSASTPVAEVQAIGFGEICLETRITPHLIAYFPGDRLIEAEDVEALGRELFARPAGSYAVVVCVDGLGSEEDLKLVERTAWRLLVNDPPSNWAHAELQAFGVYFWSNSGAASLLYQRAEADKLALAAWLRGPGADRTVLAARQTAALLEAGEDLYRQQRTKRLSNQATWTKDLASAIENISDFRARLNRRLDGDAELLVTQVAGSMRDWSDQLKESIQSALLDVFGSNKTIRPETAQAIVDKKLREASPVWAEGIASVIQTQRNELRRDSEGLFEIVDWKVVNEVARRSGLPGDFPEPLLSRALAGGDAFEERVSNGLPSGAPRQREGAFSHNLVVMGLPITVGVGAAASWLMHFPIGIPIGVLAGLISTVAATQKSNAGCDIAQCREFAAEAVRHFLDRAISHFQSEARMVAARFRQRVGEEVRKLDDLLGNAMQESYRSAGGPDDKEITEHIEGLRKRLAALLT